MHTWKSTGNIRLSRLFKISANRGRGDGGVVKEMRSVFVAYT